MRIWLVGDVGGTKTHLMAYQPDTGTIIFDFKYKNHVFASLTVIILDFLGKLDGVMEENGELFIDESCFALAGPVEGNTCKITNLDWVITIDDLSQALDTNNIVLINDLTAAAYYVNADLELEGLNKTITLLKQAKETGLDNGSNQVFLGLGTGYGLSYSMVNDGKIISVATESGHTGFSPSNQDQIKLQTYIRDKGLAPTIENVCSSIGIRHIFEFLQEDLDITVQNPELRKILKDAVDPSAVIFANIKTTNEELIRKTFDLFVDILKGEIRNICLRYNPKGGLYLTGGIISQINAVISGQDFLTSIATKHPVDEIIENIPMYVIDDEKFGVKGCVFFIAW